MSDRKGSPLDLLALPEDERQILFHLSRTGAAGVSTLAAALDQDAVEIRAALYALQQKKRVRPEAGGRYAPILGEIGPPTALPRHLQTVLMGTDRLYTEQELEALKTVVPMLQFARAKLSDFTDHGPGHVLRVKAFATQFGHLEGLTPAELQLLRLGALFHDVGNVVDRGRHHLISQETVMALTAAGKLLLTRKEAEIVGLLCRWHRKDYDPNRLDRVKGEQIRTGLLASILRVADAMDIDHRRQDYGDDFWGVLEVFFPKNLPHFASLEEILGVRILADREIDLQVVTRGAAAGNLQITMLAEDLENTPLDWSIHQIDVTARPPNSPGSESPSISPQGETALVVFPFEPHSLVMAALSRRHLQKAGYQVSLASYPETDNSPAWLWKKKLPGIAPKAFARLLILNHQPNPSAVEPARELTGRWQSAGVKTSFLNRHEACWSQLAALRSLGAEVVLGGDWAFFWGDRLFETDLRWGRIASLCTRDPALSSEGISSEDHAVAQGLLFTVFESLLNSQAGSPTDWAQLAAGVLDRIERDDVSHFSGLAPDFQAGYLDAATACRNIGRVLVYDQPPGPLAEANYWILEKAIEDHGRRLSRGIRFNRPYALTRWPEGAEIEVLAISHWLEEEAVPVRLLFPGDLGVAPQGNECTLRFRGLPERVDYLVDRLIKALNQ